MAVSRREKESKLLLTRRMQFSASHRLWRSDWDDARNRATFGAGAETAHYGRNYVLEVTLKGRPNPETGMVIDLKRLKEIMEREIGGRFDHRNLNEDTDHFGGRAPTAENLASVIFGLLEGAIPGELLYRLRLYPTADLCVEVRR